MTQFPNDSYDYRYFTITVNTPCASSSLIMPSPAPTFLDMETSVLVSKYQYPSYGYFQDSVSRDYGNGTNLCGSRSYKITSVALTASSALSLTDLQISSSWIYLNPYSNIRVGTHTATVTVFLASYPAVTLELGTFTITVTKCLVVSIKIVRASSSASLSTQTYTMDSVSTMTYQLSA